MKPNYLARTADFEGFKPSIYKDTKGKRTIGYGFNLDDPYVRKELKKQGYNVTNLLKGVESLTEQESQKLLSHFYDHSYKSASKIVKNFKDLPENVQHNLADLNYNLGTTKLLKFRKMLGALENYDFQKAAAELKDSDYYTQTKRRGKALYEDFLNTKPIQPPAPKPVVLVEEPSLYQKARTGFTQVAPFIPGGELLNKVLPYAQGGPVYNWIPPNYPRVGARNKQGGWLEKYANGDKIQQSLYTAPRSTTQTKYTPITVDPKVTLEKPNNVDNDFTKFAIDAGGTIFYPLGLLGGALDLRQGDYMGAIASLVPFGAGFKALKSLKVASKGKQAAKLNRGVNNLLVGHGATQVIDAQRDLVNPIINKKANGGWLDSYADGGDVPHDYMYSQGNVSSYRPGTSIHPIGMTNVPDSPCGPGFTIQYDETGNPVCMPIAELVPSAPIAPTVLAGANEMDYMLFNPSVYSSAPLATYSVERTTRGRNKEERFKPTKEERQATRKAIKASSLHRRPFLPGVGQFFRDVKERCFGEKCYKFENGSWVADSSIPTPTTPSYYPAGPDRTLTNYQMGTPKAPMYAHGATVWNKRLADEQMSAAYVIGPDTDGTQVKNTYPDRMSGAENPTNYRIGDYIPVGMNYKSPAAGTYDYNKDIQPYYKMRLHAPDTRRMAYGGYVPKYGFGSTIADIGKLALNTVAAPMEQITGNNFVNFNYANKGIADAAAVSEGVLGAATDIVGTTFAGPVYGMAKGQVQGITKGLGTSTEEQRGANKWANKTGQIVGSTGDLIAGIASGNPQQIVGGAGNLLGTAGGQLGSKELGMVGQLAGLSSSFINPAASTNSFGKVPQLGGTGDLISGSGMLMAKHGGRIPGLRWQQLNPGVSAPEGVYKGPTTQRGITFADGGDTSNSVRESTYVQPVYKDRIIDQDNPVEVANSLLKKYNVKVDSTSNVLKDIGLPSLGYYNPITRTIHYKNPNVLNNLTPEEREYFQTSRYINMIGAEIPHAIQSDSLGVLPFLGKIAYEGIQNPTLSRYDTEGTLEHHAHRILQPELNKKIFNPSTFSPMIERMRRSSVQPSKKKNGGWLDSYEEGGEVDITKPYLNPATVQATLARAQQPVTNTLGRVISTPASREKERREKIITNDQSKYSVEDYKKGIQEPGLEDATLEAIDALSMLSGAGYLGKKGVELGTKEIGKGVKNLIYKGVDPMFYNPSEKIKSFVPNLLSTEKDKIKRIEKIMRDSEVRGSYRKAHNRLDAWRVGLGLPQKYSTFKKTGENTFAINPELFRLEPDAQQSIIAHVKAFNLKDKYLNNIITSEQYEKGLVSINKKMHDRLDDRFSARWIKEQNIPFQPKAIVERKGDKGFSMYDQDRYAGVMGGFRWDIEDLPSNKIKLTAKDTWDLYPFEKRGVTKLSDLTSLERQKELNKGYIPALKNVEVLKLVGGKPYNIENTFIIDKYKQGGWLDNL